MAPHFTQVRELAGMGTETGDGVDDRGCSGAVMASADVCTPGIATVGGRLFCATGDSGTADASEAPQFSQNEPPGSAGAPHTGQVFTPGPSAGMDGGCAWGTGG